jgi:DNA-binding NarL/FixJ family response regulator
MMENGASGYIIKNASKDELMEAIYAAHRGISFLVVKQGRHCRNTKNLLPPNCLY